MIFELFATRPPPPLLLAAAAHKRQQEETFFASQRRLSSVYSFYFFVPSLSTMAQVATCSMRASCVTKRPGENELK